MGNDILKVVQVHESTLRKRLNEFGNTDAAKLTFDEFWTTDLESMPEEMDPPCFMAARKKEEENIKRLGEMSKVEKEILKLELKIEKELEERRSSLTMSAASGKRMRKKSVSSFNSLSSENSSHEEESDELMKVEKFIQTETLGETIENFDPDSIKRCSELDSILMPPPSSPLTRRSNNKATNVMPCSPGLGLKSTVEDYLMPSDIV